MVGAMSDLAFAHPRLAGLYDAFDPDRSDLDVYLAIARELGAQSVLDVGCGTGTFAVLLAREGFDVTGLDPARASIDVARRKPGADRVRWIVGEASGLPPLQVDLATMTANVAQAITDAEAWDATLRAAYAALRPNGSLVFETRDPALRAWAEWTPDRTRQVVDIEGIGEVESWNEVTDVALPLVSFRATYVFRASGETMVSDSTLRFRQRAEVEAQLTAAGFVLDEVRDAPDRPGRELVFLARRPS
jgi:2-polyprenyl-3-methyl-5-hydroxy-6-metoxy-1,4-benzoquinol methylase